MDNAKRAEELIRPETPCQRWRVTFARDPMPSTTAPQAGREYAALWERAVSGSGLPIAVTDAGRPRLALGAALSPGMAGRGELLDLWTTRRIPVWRVREHLAQSVPEGHRLVAVEDVWLGGPPLAGRVAGADYRLGVTGTPSAHDVGLAADRLMSAASLPRERPKGNGTRSYDLRPLVLNLEILDPGPPVVIRMRTRIHPELGVGRPEEVVAALASLCEAPLEPAEIVRERLVLVEELDG